MDKPTDEQIIAQLSAWGGDAMTYVVANRLRAKRFPVRTDWVLRQLKRLEKAGKVERVPSIYAVQLCWRPTPSRESGEAER